MTTKLEIIGPYTPEHEGPFCTRDGIKARSICRDRCGDWPIVALVSEGEGESVRMYSDRGRYSSRVDNSLDLMNSREVPQPHRFWLNKYQWGFGFDQYETGKEAEANNNLEGYIGPRLFREVLPGEGA